MLRDVFSLASFYSFQFHSLQSESTRLVIRTSCQNLLGQHAVLSNLVICEHREIILEKTSQLQLGILVRILVRPLQVKLHALMEGAYLKG
jgi:hypothetical protein